MSGPSPSQLSLSLSFSHSVRSFRLLSTFIFIARRLRAAANFVHEGRNQLLPSSPACVVTRCPLLSLITRQTCLNDEYRCFRYSMYSGHVFSMSCEENSRLALCNKVSSLQGKSYVSSYSHNQHLSSPRFIFHSHFVTSREIATHRERERERERIDRNAQEV